MTTVVRCLVCGGNGMVQDGFYAQTTGSWMSTGTGFETCRSCDGKGYVIIRDAPQEGERP